MFKIIKSKVSEISKSSKDLCECTKEVSSYYSQRLGEISDILILRNQVAMLSNGSIANALMQTMKEIVVVSVEPNRETICAYLKEAIEDLESGMDATDVLLKYEDILYRYKGWL